MIEPEKTRSIVRQVSALTREPNLDPEDLWQVFAAVREALDRAELAAVDKLRASGRSWQHIADGADLGSRQAAQQHYTRLADRIAAHAAKL